MEYNKQTLSSTLRFIPTDMAREAKEMYYQEMVALVESLKDYTRESRCILGHDEREASEFVDIFLKDKYSRK